MSASNDHDPRGVRLEKLARLRELGLDPYRVEKFDRTAPAAELTGDGFEEGKAVSFAGRVVSYRLMGKAGFAHLSDGEGRIQGYFRRDDLTPEEWEAFGLIDVGDHIGVEGELMTTKTGERSIHARKLVPLSKALHALPIGKEKDGEVFSGLSDPELRYRHRHLDLLANRDVREQLVNRSKIVSAVRRYFDSLGYLEVETPLLQLEAGGAAARPFTTHYNAYDLDVKLRISLELYLKRLICGDLPKVYEIGRVFRNEGVSSRHNPEFTMLEFYEAYVDLETMMERVEGCFRFVVDEVFGGVVAFLDLQLANIFGIRPLSESRDLLLLGTAMLNRVHQADPRLGGAQRQAMQPGATISTLSETVVKNDGLEATLLPEELRLSAMFFLEGQVDVLISLEQAVFLVVASDAAIFEHEGENLSLEKGIYEVLKLLPAISRGPLLNFHKPWRVVDLLEEIERLAGIPRSVLADIEVAKAYLGVCPVTNPINGKTIRPEDERNLGGLIEKLLEVFVEPTLQEPTFVVGYPIETSPLAKKDPNRPGFTRRFEGYVLGREVCNAFSEINDPVDQRERFEQQLREAAKGDDEAHPMDEEFLYALESGMPPTGGCGIGLDRMAMLLTGANAIREVLLFPMMKPSPAHAAEDEEEMA